jgi:hypothetical protein
LDFAPAAIISHAAPAVQAANNIPNKANAVADNSMGFQLCCAGSGCNGPAHEVTNKKAKRKGSPVK